MQPAGRGLALRLRGAPQLPEGVDRQLLGARRVDDDTGDGPRDSRVVREEHGVEVEGCRPRDKRVCDVS